METNTNNEMNIVAVIPARMGSTRFYGKPLENIHGLPMIAHVALRTNMSKSISECYVATCDEVIASYCQSIGIKSIMTKDSHERCTSRVAEALAHVELDTGKKIDIIVIIQGDEPMVTPKMIDTAISPMLHNPNIQVVNLMATVDDDAELNNPNTIKVVCDHQSDALYFSRLPVPSTMHGNKPQSFFKQVCIMPFKREALLEFESLQPTALEQAESIDMLRLLEHGHKVRMIYTDSKSKCVDTLDDLNKVSLLMQNDPLMPLYNK